MGVIVEVVARDLLTALGGDERHALGYQRLMKTS